MEHFDLHKIEKKESLEMGCEKLFNALHPDTFLGFNKKFSKKEFLDWVIANKNIVLHGSNNQYISTFEPRLANCNSKEYGNQKGIYATEDTILPMFYAIKDKDRFDGIADSGRYENDNKEKGYHFSISKDMIDKKPWSSGAIYLFDKSNFIQNYDDNGNLIDEWVCSEEIHPLGKMVISPKDFEYLDKIQAI